VDAASDAVTPSAPVRKRRSRSQGASP
jgi:hypothetical protein